MKFVMKKRFNPLYEEHRKEQALEHPERALEEKAPEEMVDASEISSDPLKKAKKAALLAILKKNKGF